MRKGSSILVLMLLCGVVIANTVEGTRHIKSKYSVIETIERGKKMMQYHGLTVFAVDYTSSRASTQQAVPPTQLLLFDAPDIGAVLVGEKRLAGLDLPLRILVWEDEEGVVWVML